MAECLVDSCDGEVVMNERDTLVADDLPLIDLVLKMHPDLEFVVLAGIHARRMGLEYPLLDPTHLRRLFPKGGTLVFRGHRVAYDQVARFLSEDYFPIPDEETLLRRALIALQRVTLSARRTFPTAGDADVTFFDPAFNQGIPGAILRSP